MTVSTKDVIMDSQFVVIWYVRIFRVVLLILILTALLFEVHSEHKKREGKGVQIFCRVVPEVSLRDGGGGKLGTVASLFLIMFWDELGLAVIGMSV